MPDTAFDERFLRSSVVIVLAHPDDESIGLSMQLARFGAQCTLIHTTDGAPRDPWFARQAGFETRQEYAALRRRELIAAVQLVGVPEQQCLTLGYVDQEASLHLAEMTRRLRDLLHQLQPKFLFTHAYEGGHPDHDATAFAVHAALQLLVNDGAMRPPVMEVPLYHMEDGQMVFQRFLPDQQGLCTEVRVPAAEQQRKQQMFACHASQARVLANFPVNVEYYRPAIPRDFTQPPHPGPLYYERHDWPLKGEQFRALAREALAELQLPTVI